MRINKELQAILNAAYQEAKQRNHEYLTPEHILYAALHFEYPRDILTECGAEPDEVRTEVDEHLKEKVPVAEDHPYRSTVPMTAKPPAPTKSSSGRGGRPGGHHGQPGRGAHASKRGDGQRSRTGRRSSGR